MSKNGRKNISFSEADHELIVQAAREHGYTVSAGASSQLGEFVFDCVIGRNLSKLQKQIEKELSENDPTN